MMWVLVLIGCLDTGEFVSSPVSVHDDMVECFLERESMALQLGGTVDGNYPINTQGICVQVEDKYFRH